jgi:enoyl-[acyl-carrier-protein] reductase (NADH)
MLEQGGGMILTLTSAPARSVSPLVGGMAAAWAGVEALTRILAAELGPKRGCVVGPRPNVIPETATIDTRSPAFSRTPGEVKRDEFIASMEEKTLRKQLPTEAVANLSGAPVVD